VRACACVICVFEVVADGACVRLTHGNESVRLVGRAVTEPTQVELSPVGIHFGCRSAKGTDSIGGWMAAQRVELVESKLCAEECAFLCVYSLCKGIDIDRANQPCSCVCCV